jgi:NADH-quinone oxidoreductase subunit J
MTEYIFYLFSFLMIIAAAMVVTSRNPVHAVLYLIFVFFNATACFILIGAEFVAMTLVIVYVGAVAVLFLFVVMMLDIKLEKSKQSFSKHLKTGLGLGLLMIFELYLAMSGTKELIPAAKISTDVYTNTEALGKVIYTEHFFSFQVAGLILLVAMIGAILLTLTHGADSRRQVVLNQLLRRKDECIEVVKVKVGDGVKV